MTSLAARRRCAPAAGARRPCPSPPGAEHEPPRRLLCGESPAPPPGCSSSGRQPGRHDARPGPGAAGPAPGRPVHRRPRAGPHRHRALRRRRPPCTTHFEADDIADSYGAFTLQRIRAVIDRSARAARTTRSRRRSRPGSAPARVRPRPGPCSSGCSTGGWSMASGAAGARRHRAVRHRVPDVRRSPGPPPLRARCRRRAYLPLESGYPLTLISPATNRRSTGCSASSLRRPRCWRSARTMRRRADWLTTQPFGCGTTRHHSKCRARSTRRCARACAPAEGTVAPQPPRRADRQRARAGHDRRSRGGCVLQ